MTKKSTVKASRALLYLGMHWPRFVIGGLALGALTIAPQVCSATPACMNIFGEKTVGLTQSSQVMRGLDGVDVDGFQTALAQGDTHAINLWYQASSHRGGDIGSQLSGELFKTNKSAPVDSNAKASTPAQVVKSARETAAKALRQQIHIQKSLGENPDAQTIAIARRQIYLLQFMAEEALVYASRLDPKAPSIVVIKSGSLTPTEVSKAGEILKIPVVAGDVIIQMSANALSSQFIGHSQSNPGLASHSALVVDTAGGEVVKLEALIEDGVNLRKLDDASTLKDVAQVWIAGLKNPADRAKAGASTQEFVKSQNIPLVGPGQPQVRSPLRYDATMNPEMIQQGAYYCTTLVEKVYLDSGVTPAQVPYRADQSNWTHLSGLEAEVYRTLSINRPQVAAPSDVFVNGEFEVRGTTVNVAAMTNGRRLHATVDGIFNTLSQQHELKAKLLHQVESLPDVSIDKQQVLQMMDQSLLMAKQKNLVADAELTKVQGMRAQILEALPEHATLRQVVFFYYLNNILQARMVSALTTFENAQPNHFATATQLRTEAEKSLTKELTQATAVLAIVNSIVPR